MVINADNDNSTLPAAGKHIHDIYSDFGDWPVILSGANGRSVCILRSRQSRSIMSYNQGFGKPEGIRKCFPEAGVPHFD